MPAAASTARVPCPICGAEQPSADFVSVHIDLEHAEPRPDASGQGTPTGTKRQAEAAPEGESPPPPPPAKAPAVVPAGDVRDGVDDDEWAEDVWALAETVAAAVEQPEAPPPPPAVAAKPPAKPAAPVVRTTQTLTAMFGGVDHGVPRYFVLDWGAERPRVYFSNARPEWTAAFKAAFEWRDQKRSLVLCTNLAPAAEPVLAKEAFYTNVPLLKSHLQKCVRRSNAPAAVATAKHLMRLDMVRPRGNARTARRRTELNRSSLQGGHGARDQGELLRRLPIIMVEDVHPDVAVFPVLVWLMAAQAKGRRASSDPGRRTQ